MVDITIVNGVDKPTYNRGHHIVQIIVAYTVTLYQAQRRSDDMTMISVGGFTNLEKY